MDRLAKLRHHLEEKYEQTNNRVLALRERLSKLWEWLDEDQIYRHNFLQAHPGCHPVTETAIKEEIKRCEQIKRQKIQVFVANMRTKIKLMWDNIMYSEAQRDDCYQDIYTENMLTLHEMYLETITKYYNENKHIFELVMTRKNLWLKQAEMDARASEPGRYHNRGGSLLREEKERKAIESNLSKIEAQLRDLVAEFEAKTGKPFTVDGVPLLQLIEDEKESRKAEQHHQLSKVKSARKQALTPSNPLFRSVATSSFGKRNRTASQLARIAEKNRRISGRLATKALVAKAENHGATVKRKLDYGAAAPKTPKANGSILKHKRSSVGKRHSGGGRRSSGPSASPARKNPLMETTQLTTYTDVEDGINEEKVSRSSMVPNPPERVIPMIVCDPIEETYFQNKSPIESAPMTPKKGKENRQHVVPLTPKNNMNTPTRLTRSALKLNNDGFATPRAPLSAAKSTVHRTKSTNNLAFKNTPSNMIRSKTQIGLVRTPKPFV